MTRPVKEVRLDLDQRKGEWEFTAWLGDCLLAVMRAQPHEGHVIMHLEVRAWSRELYREYLNCFEAIRFFFREDSRGLIFACAACCDDKMKRFWWLMGFRVFGEIEHEGRKVPYAVMEV